MVLAPFALWKGILLRIMVVYAALTGNGDLLRVRRGGNQKQNTIKARQCHTVT